MSDEQDLIRRCVRGDEHAFAELVDQYKVMVFNTVGRMVSDMAEDLAQEVFLRVYRGLPAFRGEAKLSTWIYQITYRVCLEELERPYRRQTYISLDDDSDDLEWPRKRTPAFTVDGAFDRVDFREAVDRWLVGLPPHYRMVLNLYYLQDRQYSEVAEVMGLPVGTVKTYLHRAKRVLRDYIVNKEEVI